MRSTASACFSLLVSEDAPHSPNRNQYSVVKVFFHLSAEDVQKDLKRETHGRQPSPSSTNARVMRRLTASSVAFTTAFQMSCRTKAEPVSSSSPLVWLIALTSTTTAVRPASGTWTHKS